MAKTLKDVKDRCVIDGGHWLWTGAVSAGLPNVYAPDYTRDPKGVMVSQRGARAIWHLTSRKPVPDGYRVFRSCDEPMCVNPANVECIACQEWGRQVADSGRWKNNMARIIANRRTGQKRSKLSHEKVHLILASDKSGRQLAEELGSSRSSISRVRAGHPVAFTPIAGIFAGLGAR